MTVVEHGDRDEGGRIKVTWTVIPASDEKHYLVPMSDADKLEDEFSRLRDQLEGAVKENARLHGIIADLIPLARRSDDPGEVDRIMSRYPEKGQSE